MSFRTWLAGLGQRLRTGLTGWLLVAALVVLGFQRLGWHRLTAAGTWAWDVLSQTVLLVRDIGWLLLLLAAVGLALYIIRWPSKAAWLSGRTALRRRLSDLAPIRDGDVTAIGVVIGVALLLGAGLAAIFWLPQRLVPRTESFTHNDRLKVINDVRSTLLQAAAGLGAIIAGLRTWLTVNERGQLTERFTSALENLANPNLEVRLAAIFALERVARDSARDREAIAEILTGYVRARSPWPPRAE